MPVGSERVNAYGYVDIKIADPSVWRGKHLLLWEAANGPLPKGHVVIFADGNRRNFALDNLLKVSRGELAVLNHFSLITNDTELTKMGLQVARLKGQISRRQKEPANT